MLIYLEFVVFMQHFLLVFIALFINILG